MSSNGVLLDLHLSRHQARHDLQIDVRALAPDLGDRLCTVLREVVTEHLEGDLGQPIAHSWRPARPTTVARFKRVIGELLGRRHHTLPFAVPFAPSRACAYTPLTGFAAILNAGRLPRHSAVPCDQLQPGSPLACRLLRKLRGTSLAPAMKKDGWPHTCATRLT